MATKNDCIRAAQKAGDLTKKEATNLVERMQEENTRIQEAVAEGKVANANQALQEAWTKRLDDERRLALQQKKHAAINIRVRNSINSLIDSQVAQGHAASDVLEALMVGSNKRILAARRSVDAKRAAIYRQLAGRMVNEIEKLDFKAFELLKRDIPFRSDVVRELHTPSSTQSLEARQVAGIFSKYMEESRLRLNEAGADIGSLGNGYIPQTHDPFKITRKGKNGAPPRDSWIDFISQELDLERTFGEDAANPEMVKEILGHAYDNIQNGRDYGPNAIERGEYVGPRNLANSLGRHRVFFFKDADAYMRYNTQYGAGNPFDAIMGHMSSASRKLSLMETFGPNPENMIKSIIAERQRLLNEQVRAQKTGATREQVKELETLRGLWTGGAMSQGRAAVWFSVLSGEASWPVMPSVARTFSVLRAVQSTAKLGGASLSAIADVFIKASSMRVNGLNWGESITKATTQYFEKYGAGKRALARDLGAFSDNLVGELNMRWDVNDALPGRISNLQNKFFKWSGLNWITENGKAGYIMWLSDHIGSRHDLDFGNLPASHRALLEYHGFTSREWPLLQRMTQTAEDGRQMLTPGLAENLPDSMIIEYLGNAYTALSRIPDPELRAIAQQNAITRAKRDLNTNVMSMFVDESLFAIIEPDAKVKASMYQGTRPGTVLGESLRLMMQFKSFPISYMQRVVGGRRWIKGESQAGLRRGLFNSGTYADALTRDIPGGVGFALAAFSFGYIAMSAKDIARGKKPRDPSNIETVMSALMQSGGAGILGDLLFDKVNRFGNTFTETLTGPAFGEIGRVVGVLQQLARGELEDAGSDTLRLLFDNMPMVNLWYTREAINWLMLYHLREMMSPGTLARTERKMKEDYNQEFFVSPSSYIKKGGGFR